MLRHKGFTIAIAASLLACAGTRDADDDTDQGALKKATPSETLAFAVVDDAGATVEASRDGYEFTVAVRRGRDNFGYKCFLARDDGARPRLECYGQVGGLFAITRTSSDSYDFALVKEQLVAAQGAKKSGEIDWDEEDPMRSFLASPKKLRVTQAGDENPFTIADRIEQALEKLVGKVYGVEPRSGGGPIRRVPSWWTANMIVQSRFEYGESAPYRMTSAGCRSSSRPSILENYDDPRSKFISADELADRHIKVLETVDNPTSCK